MFVSNANFVYTINLEVAIYYRHGAAPHLGTACLVQTSLRAREGGAERTALTDQASGEAHSYARKGKERGRVVEFH